MAGERGKMAVMAGLSPETAEQIAALPLDKIMAIARSGLISFCPRIPEKLWRDIQQNDYPESLLQARIALAIAGEPQHGHQT